jgi:uncharacterized protein YlxW (UPF0749 family)
MTRTEIERVAVLEAEVRSLQATIDKMSRRQDEMYELMLRTKGGWQTLLLIGGVAAGVGALVAKFWPFVAR